MELNSILLAIVIPAAMSAGLSLLIRRFAPLIGLIDTPNYRKVHEKRKLVGGIAPAIAFFAYYSWIGQNPLPVLGGIGLVTLLGLADDIRSIGALKKLFIQVLSTLPLVFLLEIPLVAFTFPQLGEVIISEPWNAGIYVFWILASINAFNLIDGLDGLALGLGIIATLAFFLSSQSPNGVITAVCLMGSLGGFIYFNIRPAQLFLGDGGSYFLGYSVGYLSTRTFIGLNQPGLPRWSFIPAALVIAVPLVDTFLAIMRRTRKGGAIFSSDQEHIHHKLMKRFGHTKAVIVLCSVQLLLAGFGVLYWSVWG